MPRPKPLVALHGAVNFDRLVPFDSASSAPPLAVNDILVMRRAAGGDNVTLSIGDITATGAVNIDQLLGGNNGDMLFRRAGIWQPTGPEGLSYDGFSMILNNDNLNFQGNAQIFNAGSGDWTQSSTGNINISGSGNFEISGTGGFEMSGGGDLQVSGGGAIMLTGGNIELSGGAGIEVATDGEITVSGGGGIFLDAGATLGIEGGNGIEMEGGAGITIVDAGEIVMGDGAILADDGTEALPGIAFRDDLNTGLFRSASDILVATVGGGEMMTWQRVGPDRDIIFHSSMQGDNPNGPFINQTSVTAGTTAGFIPNKTDFATGIGWLSVGNLTIVAGNDIAVRVEDPADLAALETSLHIFDNDNNTVEQVTVGAADSGGAGFKLLRIPN